MGLRGFLIVVLDKHLLHVYAFTGKDYHLTEYVDFKDDTGVYRKQRTIFIDGEPLARDEEFDEDWNVHASSRVYMAEHPKLGIEVERVRQLESESLPPVRPALLEIGRRIGLDYFGLDCNIDHDGHVLVFEAAASIDFLQCPVAELQPWLDQIRLRMRLMISTRTAEVIA